MRCRCMTTRWVVEEQVNHFEFDTRNITAYRDVPLGYKNEPTTMHSTRGIELPTGVIAITGMVYILMFIN